MLHPDTRLQIEALTIRRDVPLVLCDVDEVVVHFLTAFEEFLAGHDLWLDTSSFALNGNIKQRENQHPVAEAEVARLITDFFATRTRHLVPIPGALSALDDIADHATLVMLTNLPGAFRQDRIENLMGHGLHHPVVVNSGPKGPAVELLADGHEAPVIFIDDSPSYLTSAHAHYPQGRFIHFLQDQRLSPHVAPLDFISLRTDNWPAAHAHVRAIIAGEV